MRYEYWLEVIQLAEGLGYAVFENVENVTEDWTNYSPEGWDLKLKLEWNVKGVISDRITNFNAETTITLKDLGEEPDEGSTFAASMKFYNSLHVQVKSVLEDEDTYIIATFTGDTTVFATGGDFYGYIFEDTDEGGSVFSRRFANTEYDSESSTPFRAGDDPGDATISRADGNVRISVYPDKVILSTIYSNIIQDENRSMSDILTNLFYARIGFTDNQKCFLLDKDGDPVLNATLDGIIINC